MQGAKKIDGTDFRKNKDPVFILRYLSRMKTPLFFTVNKPIIGSNMFMCKSGIGIDKMKKMPLAMFFLNLPFVGNQTKVVLEKNWNQ